MGDFIRRGFEKWNVVKFEPQMNFRKWGTSISFREKVNENSCSLGAQNIWVTYQLF